GFSDRAAALLDPSIAAAGRHAAAVRGRGLEPRPARGRGGTAAGGHALSLPAPARVAAGGGHHLRKPREPDRRRRDARSRLGWRGATPPGFSPPSAPSRRAAGRT